MRFDREKWQSRRRLAMDYLRAAHIPWKRVLSRLVGGEMILFASGIAFCALLTMIPLLLISAWGLGTVLQSESGVSELRAILGTVFPPQPFADSIKESIIRIVGDIVQYRTSIGLVGIGVLIVTATFLFDVIRTVLHRIYGLPRKRNFLVSFLHDIWFVSVAWVLLVLTNLAIWVYTVFRGVLADVPALKGIEFPGLLEQAPTTIVFLITAAMFYIVYRYITDTKPPRAAAIASTVTMTVLWLASGKVFAIYLEGYSLIGTIYGPYTFLLVLLLLIYYSSLVFVVGGIIGQVYWEGLQERRAYIARKSQISSR